MQTRGYGDADIDANADSAPKPYVSPMVGDVIKEKQWQLMFEISQDCLSPVMS